MNTESTNLRLERKKERKKKKKKKKEMIEDEVVNRDHMAEMRCRERRSLQCTQVLKPVSA